MSIVDFVKRILSEEEKVEILKEQLKSIEDDETESERLKAKITRLGYSPDRSTW